MFLPDTFCSSFLWHVIHYHWERVILNNCNIMWNLETMAAFCIYRSLSQWVYTTCVTHFGLPVRVLLFSSDLQLGFSISSSLFPPFFPLPSLSFILPSPTSPLSLYPPWPCDHLLHMYTSMFSCVAIFISSIMICFCVCSPIQNYIYMSCLFVFHYTFLKV